MSARRRSQATSYTNAQSFSYCDAQKSPNSEDASWPQLHGLTRSAVALGEIESDLRAMHGNPKLKLIKGGQATAFKCEGTQRLIRLGKASLYNGDAMDSYDEWLPPACIIADGPYGLGKFPGEPKSPDSLAEWYAPHAAAWARRAQPFTTLWFWNSEIGWAKSHPALEMHGWQYEETVVWDKGIAHVAGNCNSKTIRGVPVVTELAVRYTRKVTLETADGKQLPIKEWLRAEWLRSGRPMYESNKACGVVNAATRKYLTQCHMWYFPPGDAVVGMAKWCGKHGAKTQRPYFSIDGKSPPSAEVWDRMRAKWTHAHGLTNVWREPPIHNGERVRVPGSGSRYLHANQKPLALMERQILASTSPNDAVWEPFGGLCSATVAAIKMGRIAHAAEMNKQFFDAAVARVRLSNLTPERIKRFG